VIGTLSEGRYESDFLTEHQTTSQTPWYWVASRRGQYPLLYTAEEVAEMPLFQRVAVLAFTMGELGELLPGAIEQDNEVLQLRCEKSSRGFTVAYGLRGEQHSRIEHKAPSEAEARAQMLLSLIENNLYTP
jgi:hypothetical protein